MPRVRDLHIEHNHFPEVRTLYLSHRYSRTKKTWEFEGWRCVGCGIVFKRPNTVPQHPMNCKFRPKKEKNENEFRDLTIVNVDRQLWEPIDFNQIRASNDTLPETINIE